MVKEFRFILRGEGCKADLSVEKIRAFFYDLTAVLGMHVWKRPRAWEMKMSGLEPGFSGDVIWHESGCQLHNYATEAKTTLDIYSCRDFSLDLAQRLFEAYFEPEEVRNCVPVLRSNRG